MNAHGNEARSKTNPNKTIKADFSSAIKKLQLKEENSTCFDCGCKGTTYYVLNFGTFVCSKCAGILRELRYKVKGISVSLFSEEEKIHAEMMGNERARKVWMRLFNYKSCSIPCNTQKDFKKHLKDKYILKKYFKKSKETRRVRFDSEASDSDSSEDNNQRDEEEEGEECDEEGEEESEEEDDKDKEADEGEAKETKDIEKAKPQKTAISEIKIKKPHSKVVCESMKYSKKAWEDLWEKADLTKLKEVSINDFEFIDSTNTSDINHNCNHNQPPTEDLLIFPNESSTQDTQQNPFSNK